ncbi:hypothetical protein B296_00050036 [Ensete ventricosum]|uniref:Uncharacterized protein n=1 Tax=Ensete ventricosum TaxID=4639 RepID=A0A426X0T8_ENSVE|nr:hypothetical protein B296_00050036 [Ensete ventricosum]
MGDPLVKTTLLRPFSCPSDENQCRRHSSELFLGSKFCHDRYEVIDAWGPKRAFRIGVATAIPITLEKATVISARRGRIYRMWPRHRHRKIAKKRGKEEHELWKWAKSAEVKLDEKWWPLRDHPCVGLEESFPDG